MQQEGLLDTNVFVHAQTRDAHSAECRKFLGAIEAGTVHATLEPMVLHELSYALPHYVKQMSRKDVAVYLISVLSWKGVVAERDLLVDVVQRWSRTPRLAFVDAYLAALAMRRNLPIYSKNVRELRTQAVAVPNPLPHSN